MGASGAYPEAPPGRGQDMHRDVANGPHGAGLGPCLLCGRPGTLLTEYPAVSWLCRECALRVARRILP